MVCMAVGEDYTVQVFELYSENIQVVHSSLCRIYVDDYDLLITGSRTAPVARAVTMFESRFVMQTYRLPG